MVVKVAVIGAGINGLACAVKIKEKYKSSRVVLISSDFSPNTTGDGAGGLWHPYLCGSTPGHLLSKWGGETYDLLYQLWREGGYGVCLMPLFSMYRIKPQHWAHPEWANHVFGYHALDDIDLKYLSKLFSVNYAAGITFSTFIFAPPPILEYLYQRFKNSNGEVLQGKVSSLHDPILQGFDVVVNCTGLNAKYVVPDGSVFSYRGQITKVIAPWINYSLSDEDSGHYIIPNATTCVLGGTHQEHDFNTNVDNKDTEYIMNGCKSMMPSLQSAAIHSQWVGLRPGRREVRLEAEERDGRLVIHNYGHGGSGLTLFWGCATDVLELMDKYLSERNRQKSKL